ncbi:Protein of unknown function [Gryllus bimaculatus]|nr:Protein of unknown function [Gryllus bimaculatus]
MASGEAATAAAGEPVVRGSAARARCERAPRAPAGRARHGASVVLIRGQARGEPCIPRRNSSRRKCLSGGACCFVLCRCSEASRRVKSVWCSQVLIFGVSFRLSLRPRQPHLSAAASAPPQHPPPAPPPSQLQRRRGAHERVDVVYATRRRRRPSCDSPLPPADAAADASPTLAFDCPLHRPALSRDFDPILRSNRVAVNQSAGSVEVRGGRAKRARAAIPSLERQAGAEPARGPRRRRFSWAKAAACATPMRPCAEPPPPQPAAAAPAVAASAPTSSGVDPEQLRAVFQLCDPHGTGFVSLHTLLQLGREYCSDHNAQGDGLDKIIYVIYKLIYFIIKNY